MEIVCEYEKSTTITILQKGHNTWLPKTIRGASRWAEYVAQNNRYDVCHRALHVVCVLPQNTRRLNDGLCQTKVRGDTLSAKPSNTSSYHPDIVRSSITGHKR